MAIKDTSNIMPLIDEIFKHYGHVKDGDFMRELMALILNKLMEAEVTSQIGANKY
uniref:transposase n=1 Tax=Acetivibrio cellulolyticus TaxID=35830 RepID=UPI0001E2C7EE|nr:transposase [Acetivibrio cellulolyticus]